MFCSIPFNVRSIAAPLVAVVYIATASFADAAHYGYGRHGRHGHNRGHHQSGHCDSRAGRMQSGAHGRGIHGHDNVRRDGHNDRGYYRHEHRDRRERDGYYNRRDPNYGPRILPRTEPVPTPAQATASKKREPILRSLGHAGLDLLENAGKSVIGRIGKALGF